MTTKKYHWTLRYLDNVEHPTSFEKAIDRISIIALQNKGTCAINVNDKKYFANHNTGHRDYIVRNATTGRPLFTVQLNSQLLNQEPSMKQNPTNNTLASIGEPHQGGFLAGVINVNGQRFGLIVAPKSIGERESSEWGEYGKKIDGANSCCDGEANTRAMVEAGSKLAKWALELDINGFNDWYLPSRDELELLYRHFKPTDNENCCSFRDGDNPSTVPTGYPYLKESPAQTAADGFKSRDENAFSDEWYWSSTQYSAHLAWDQYFANGLQLLNGKDFKARARAVRRVVIHSSI